MEEKMIKNETGTMELVGDNSVLNQQEELTEEQKRLIELQSLIASRNNYKPKKVYNSAFRKERKKKNRTAKKSRKNSRKS